MTDRDTTPLGGSQRRQRRRNTFFRNWTGYVPLIRACPACGTENGAANRFCVGCVALIADIEPTASENPNSGVRAMEERIRRESDEARRTRAFTPDAGTGLVITGVLLLIVTIWFPMPWPLRVGMWVAGLLLACTGLVRMRSDASALRRTGVILGASSIGLLAIVVTRGAAPPDELPVALAPTAIASPVAVATPVASPVSTRTFANVPTLLGDAAHSGLQPGPAPAANPQLAWRFDTGSEILASPIVAGNIVFVTNREGVLHAVDATTGAERWRAEIGPYVLRTTPAWADGALYLVAGFDALAIDADTGDVRWRHTIRYAGTASPTVVGDSMFVVSQEGLIYALATDDGRELWRGATDGISFGAPAGTDQRLVVATDSGMVNGLNPETGRPAWRRDLGVPIYTSPVIVGDIVWIVSTDGLIHGLSLETGQDRHRIETTADLPVTATDSTVFAPSDDGGIYAITSETGDVQWFATTGGEIRAGPVRTDAQVVATGGNRIAGFDTATGEQVWYFLAGDAIEASPAVSTDYVFFGARDGVLYAITDAPPVP